MQGALDGLVVLDATQMLAGPLCSMRLGDLGADVIKVEPPNGGEFNRTHGFDDVQVGGDMTTFLAVNRNKRSFAVDLKSADGLAAFLDLVRTADVLVQNFRHGTAERLGVGYAQLAAVNPRLVYCSISGYGSAGPYRDRPGQDLVLQGYSGSMFSVGAAGDAPVPGALWAADVMTGYTAAIGILAALASRTSTGAGQHVEVDMFSVVLDAQVQELVTYLNAGAAPRRMQEPTAHGSIPAPYGVYRTADGWMTLAMSPLPALGERPRRRVAAHAGPLQRRARAPRRGLPAHPDRFTGRTTADWVERCDVHGVWAGPVHDYPSLVDDPHVQATGMITEQPHPTLGSVRTTRVPVQLSGTPVSIRRGAPPLGADTADILRERLGYDAERIEQLAGSGAVSLGRDRRPRAAAVVTTTPGTVRLERDGHVAILTLDRPAKLNAMSVDMDRQMNERVFEINNDDSVRSVLLTGAPGRAFCVGSDIEDLDGYGTHWQYRNRFDARLDYARAVWLLRKPVVAAIHGYCIGGGLEMACASDVRLASPDSTFAAGR
jgi:crotonobetainyl-CoA:carnitine CoA-transferase CaiB-like acyl-CoA transferase